MAPFLQELGLVPRVPPPSPDAPEPTPSRAELWITALVAAALGLVLCLSFEPWSVAIQGLDSMFYYFTAERAGYGTPPHLSAFSPQNALGVVLPGIGIAFGRLLGADAVMASRVVTIGLYAASVGLVALLGRELTGRRSGAVVATLVFLSFVPLAFAATATGQPKTVLVFFVVLTLFAVKHDRFGVAGMAAAAAYLSYQPGLVLLPGVLVAAVTSLAPANRLKAAMLGFVAPVIGYAAYLGLGGALAEAFAQTHRFMAASRGGGLPDLGEVYYTWQRIWKGGFGTRNLLPLVGIAGLLVFCGVALARLRTAFKAARHEPVWMVILVSGAGVGAYALLDFGGVPDTFLGLTFMTVFTTVVLDALVEWAGHLAGGAVRAVATIVVALGLLYVFNASYEVQRGNVMGYGLTEQRQAASEVGRLLAAGNRVYVLGFPYLLSMNHVDNWSIYSSSHSVRPETGYWEYRHPGQDFVPVRGDSLPDVIVWSRGRPAGWPEWLSTHYVRIGSAAIDRIGAEVWIRRAGDKG